MFVKVINTIEELQSLIPQWEGLVNNATEENLNYEPIPLISLLSGLDYPDWFVTCVWADENLLGLFPMQSEPTLPLGTTHFASLFKNHFLSCAPLVHKEHIDETLTAFWKWFNSGQDAKIFRYSEMLPNSLLAEKFVMTGNKQSATVVETMTTTRAIGTFLQGDFDEYIANQLSAKSRSSNRSKHRKLASMGGWSSVFTSEHDEDLTQRFDDLVSVEASGWKKENGSAIEQHENLKKHMLCMAEYAASKNRFLLANAYLGEIPVAGMYCIVNNNTLQVYKIGFNENFKAYSVGQLLLLDLIRYVIDNPAIDKIDSCAVADSEMYNRCLPDQQPVHVYQIASNHMASKLIVKAATHTRAIRNQIRYKRAG